MHQGKTECVLFGSNPKVTPAKFCVTVNGKALKRVTEYKYIGVILDESLTWKERIKYLIAKAGKRIGMLGRTRKNISMASANQIYKSFIVPILDYCDAVWNCCGIVNSDRVEKLQRRAARKVMKSESSEDALQQLRYSTLKSRRDRHTLNLVKRCLENKCPQFLRNYFIFNRDVSVCTTRLSDMLRTPTVKLESTKRAFFYHGCKGFNNQCNTETFLCLFTYLFVCLFYFVS